MLNLKAKAVITDIEGTTTDINFVHKVLFPYARARMADFIEQHHSEAAVRQQLQATAEASGLDAHDLKALATTLIQWIDQDRKIGPLKALQGMIWKTGYEAGDFRGHVYADAHTGLQRWHRAGIALYVYSSGSVAAQQLLFGHSDFGDLRPWFNGYFDTAIGGKRETDSYRNIVSALQQPAESLVFLSDVVEELDAASEAGMQCAQLIRSPDMRSGAHPQITSFDEIIIEAYA